MIPRNIVFELALMTVILLGCTGQVTNAKRDFNEVRRVSTKEIPACEHLGSVALVDKFIWWSYDDARAELKRKMKEIVAERGGNSYHVNIFDDGPLYLLVDYYKCPDTIPSK
jgi:hypothetical protein